MNEDPPLLEAPATDLARRHEDMLARRREQRLGQLGEYPPTPQPQPVHRLVYWIVSAVTIIMLGCVALAWYAVGSVVMLAEAGADREDKLLGIIQEMQAGAAEAGDSTLATVLAVLVVGGIIIAVIIQAMKG